MRAAETPAALADDLSQRDFWRDWLNLSHAQAFTAIGNEFAARGDALDEGMNTLTSQVYTQRWEDLRNERESALQALMLQLTLDALEADAVQPG
ncbi:hypothetical protein KSS90_17215 [Pseudomonas maumuensis]|uniref:NEL domain-containing protein n=1 Tax=Pseudomonas maumuensis TaxID=2842354 RepID=A0ABX8NT93_9PSED|nr:hypothetical protein KSS90_17215 [Pseudomonas maumuensis]